MKNNINRCITYTLVLIMCASVLLFASCADDKATEASTLTPLPRYEDTSKNEDASFGDNAKAVLVKSVAYLLPGSVLYGAIEYENTGDCPITLSGAEFIFSVDGKDQHVNAAQPMHEYCVLYPGEKSYFAAWIEPEEGAQYESAELSDVVLQYEKSDPDRKILTVSELKIANNYPKFATVTGSLEYNGNGECPLNTVYIGFYDKNDALLGVWYFTDDTTVYPDRSARFSTHMRNLTVDGLADKTARMEAFAFGID